MRITNRFGNTLASGSTVSTTGVHPAGTILTSRYRQISWTARWSSSARSRAMASATPTHGWLRSNTRRPMDPSVPVWQHSFMPNRRPNEGADGYSGPRIGAAPAVVTNGLAG
jgi:hypothetical protein